MDIVIFNVEHGQSILFYPHGAPGYTMLVDCGNTQEFNPIDTILHLLPQDQLGRRVLSNLALTNYDHDHFSGLPYLADKVHISTVSFAKNLTSGEIRSLKEESTDALDKLCEIKDTYIHDAPYHTPPYARQFFHLEKHHFPNGDYDTNNLSQVMFVNYHGTTICIGGDLEAVGWTELLKNDGFKEWLRAIDIFIASHHGRENGYAEEIFQHCSPECVIISDKEMVHGTQDGMAQTYASHVRGNGVTFGNLRALTGRKVLTTRNDGHILIKLAPNGVRAYAPISL